MFFVAAFQACVWLGVRTSSRERENAQAAFAFASYKVTRAGAQDQRTVQLLPLAASLI